MHPSLTSTYITNFIEIEEMFCGWTDGCTDGHLRPTLLGRLGGVDLTNTSKLKKARKSSRTLQPDTERQRTETKYATAETPTKFNKEFAKSCKHVPWQTVNVIDSKISHDQFVYGLQNVTPGQASRNTSRSFHLNASVKVGVLHVKFTQ